MSRTLKCLRYIEPERMKRVVMRENTVTSVYVVTDIFKTVFSTSECVGRHC